MNLFALLLGAIWRVFRARRELLLENLALRQQLAALKRRHPRPRLTIFDKAFWILAHVFWSAGWKQVLAVVTPETAPRFIIFDRDAKYGLEVPAAVHSLKMSPVRTSFESPWQNGVAERWVGSCRRDLLDHVIALNERHLKRLLSEHVSYDHEDRTRWGLVKETPGGRTRSLPSGHIGSGCPDDGRSNSCVALKCSRGKLTKSNYSWNG